MRATHTTHFAAMKKGFKQLVSFSNCSHLQSLINKHYFKSHVSDRYCSEYDVYVDKFENPERGITELKSCFSFIFITTTYKRQLLSRTYHMNAGSVGRSKIYWKQTIQKCAEQVGMWSLMAIEWDIIAPSFSCRTFSVQLGRTIR